MGAKVGLYMAAETKHSGYHVAVGSLSLEINYQTACARFVQSQMQVAQNLLVGVKTFDFSHLIAYLIYYLSTTDVASVPTDVITIERRGNFMRVHESVRNQYQQCSTSIMCEFRQSLGIISFCKSASNNLHIEWKGSFENYDFLHDGE